MKTFILGAGSSRFLGYPAGSELIQEVVSLLDLFPRTMTGARSLGNALAHSGHVSIDAFIAQYGAKPDQINLLKTLVAIVLLKRETSEIVNIKKGDWIKLLLNDVGESGLKDINFVSFNYDRGFLQHLASLLLHRTTNRTWQEALTLAKQNFYPVMGRLPNLESEITFQSAAVYRYGTFADDPITGDTIPARYKQLADLVDLLQGWATTNMFTLEEATNNFSKSMRDKILASSSIVFLGNQFHPENMDLLQVEGTTSKLVGTCHHLHQTKIAQVERHFKIDLRNATCYGLLANHYSAKEDLIVERNQANLRFMER